MRDLCLTRLVKYCNMHNLKKHPALSVGKRGFVCYNLVHVLLHFAIQSIIVCYPELCTELWLFALVGFKWSRSW